MATTFEDIKAWLEVQAEAHGMESMAIIESCEYVHTRFGDVELIGSQDGDEARWGSRDWIIYRLPSEDFVGVQFYNGATENQDSSWEGVVKKMTREQVTQTVYKPSDA